MANLRALRRQLEAEIKALQKELDALDLVERRLAGKVRTRRSAIGGRSGSVTDAVRQAVLAEPSKPWNAADALKAVRDDGAPNASKANVSTALRRLTDEGVLEKVSGNRRVGFTYRVKTGAG